MAYPFQGPDLLANLPRGDSRKDIADQSIPKAYWQSQEKIENSIQLAYDHHNPGGKMLWGAIGGKLLGFEDDRHALTIAGSRSGKTLTAIANQFFWRGSMIVVDPKGENAMLCAEQRSKLGNDVYVVDPYEIVGGKAQKFRAKYNEIKTLDIDSLTVIEDARKIAMSVVIQTGSENDPHWNNEAENLILGFILFVAFGAHIKDEFRNLCFVREIILGLLEKAVHEDEDGPKEYWKWLNVVKHGIEPLLWDEVTEGDQTVRVPGPNADIGNTIWGLVNGFFDKADDERSGVHSNAKRHTAYLDTRAQANIRTGHDFDLKDVKRGKKPVTVYVVLPANRLGENAGFLRTFVNQLIDAVTAIPNQPGRIPTLALLDEFPVLGYMKALEDAVGQLASFQLKFHFIIQDKGQLDALYGKRAESFIGNCGVIQAFGNTDLGTLKYISEKLGNSPVGTRRISETTQGEREQGKAGQSTDITMYPLATPDELERYFGRDDNYRRQILFIAGYRPIVISRIAYFDKSADYAPIFANFVD